MAVAPQHYLGDLRTPPRCFWRFPNTYVQVAPWHCGTPVSGPPGTSPQAGPPPTLHCEVAAVATTGTATHITQPQALSHRPTHPTDPPIHPVPHHPTQGPILQSSGASGPVLSGPVFSRPAKTTRRYGVFQQHRGARGPRRHHSLLRHRGAWPEIVFDHSFCGCRLVGIVDFL